MTAEQSGSNAAVAADPDPARVVLRGHLQVWEGFWAGWRNRWCILTEQTFSYFTYVQAVWGVWTLVIPISRK